MQTRQLGNSDLQITPVGYGAWAIGGSGWQFAWGSQDDNDSIAAIHRSLEIGRELDRYRRRIWPRSLRGGCRAGSENLVWPQALRLHQMRPALGRAR